MTSNYLKVVRLPQLESEKTVIRVFPFDQDSAESEREALRMAATERDRLEEKGAHVRVSKWRPYVRLGVERMVGIPSVGQTFVDVQQERKAS